MTMKKSITILLCAAMLAALTACGSNTAQESAHTSDTAAAEATEETTEAEEISPFSDVEDNYKIELPIYMMTESALFGSAHYAENFQFDEADRLVAFSAGERKRRDNFTIEYDDLGRKKKITKDNPMYGYTREFVYDDANRLIRESSIGYREGVADYVYDENGQISQTIYDDHVMRHEYEYDEKGRVIKELYYRSEGGKESLEYVYEYEYNPDTEQIDICRSTGYDDGSVASSYVYTILYDAYGHWINQDYGKRSGYARYDVAGYETVSQSDSGYLDPASDWQSFEEYEGLPLPSSVFSGSCKDVSDASVGHLFRVKEEKTDQSMLRLMGRANGIAGLANEDPIAYSFYPETNKILWSYEAVLTQLLGFEMNDIGEGKFGISKDGIPAATLSTEWSDGICYLKLEF